jgi:hypothetical protein
MFRPAGRFLTIPLPPGRPDLARLLATVILPPLLFFAILKSPPFLLKSILIYRRLQFPQLHGSIIEVFKVKSIVPRYNRRILLFLSEKFYL